ncbi:MAG: hypothetical protein R3A79_05145 [Nannocystaceae bacterium]
MDDPERQRVEELLACVTRGAVSEAEREELQLYAEAHPELREAIARAEARGELGQGWLARVEADDAIATIEGSRGTMIERGVGLALLFGGLVASFGAPITGSAALVAGLLILVASFVRVRLATHRSDPYKDVQR